MQIFNDLLYPGTYNPIHNGHLDIAEKARLEIGAQKVILIPAFSPYHKTIADNTTFADRLEMTKLAAASRNGFEVSDVEFRMGKEKSYTFETIKQLIEETLQKPFKEDMKLPNKIKLLLGADALEKIESWYQASKLSKLVEFIVVSRPHCSDIKETVKKVNLPDFSFKNIYANIDISSRTVKEFLQRNQDISTLTPKSVSEYILKNKLYK